MMTRFTRAEIDPITNRKLSDNCWNGNHDPRCNGYMCDCGCHDNARRRQRQHRPEQLDVSQFGTIKV